ncbi:MFS general substrate transporter, partial [Microthyrium microscopicum]
LVCFISALDQTITATAIPTIASSLHSAGAYTWIGAAYLLASAASGPLWTKCSDIWGRKLALLSATVLFGAASVLAALSSSMTMLISARALQGAAGGGLGGLVSVTISDLVSVRERAKYFAALGLMWAVAGAAGPAVGGVLTERVSWRWCFWINVPVCGLAGALILLLLDVHNPRTGLKEGLKAVDWYGTVTMLGVTLMVLLGLDFGGAVFAWSSAKVICLLIFGTLMVGMFVYSEKRLAKYPLLPLGVFGSVSNVATFGVSFFQNMVSLSVEYYLPLYLQSVKLVSPLRSGILVLPMMCTMALTDITVGILISKTGRYREMMWIGATILTLGTGLYITLGVDTPIAQIVGFQIVWGVGPALLFYAPMIAIQNTVSQADTASATAALGFFRNVATSLSIVVGGVVFQNSMTSQQSSLVAAGLDASTRKAFSGSQAAANVDLIKLISDSTQRRAIQNAFAGSLRNMFITYTGLAAAALVSSAFIKHRKLNTEHTETKTGIQELTKRKE